MLSTIAIPKHLDSRRRYVFVQPSSPTGALQRAIDGAAPKTTIFIAPGDYNEAIVIPATATNLALVGMGGRGAEAVAPQAAGAEGMRVLADDVTLVNVGVAGASGADYALNVRAAARFRAHQCKFEGPTGAVVLLDGTADDQVADALLDDCEFAWGGSGILFDNSAYGYPTQVRIRNSWFHNLTAVGVGLASGGGVTNLELRDCVFDNQEDGTAPTHYVKVDRAGDTGIVTGCRFAFATNEADKMAIAAGILWVANATEAGWTTARPS